MDSVSLITAERVADLIRGHAWREMPLCLVDARAADTRYLATRRGVGRENGRISARRRTRETHMGGGRGSRKGQLRGWERWLEAPVA